jgi:predicted DsbA family dithiol-disulfide isomerase
VRTARLVEQHDLLTRYTLFPLHPSTPKEGLTLEQLFGDRARVESATRQMTALMAEEGLEFGERSHTYNSRSAQELAKWAETQGVSEIHDALYKAYFVEGSNLAMPEVLEGVAESVGLDGSEATRAIESGAHGPAVDADWERARSLGVTGVPTFAVGNRGVVGAQPYEVLESLVLSSKIPPDGSP